MTRHVKIVTSQFGLISNYLIREGESFLFLEAFTQAVSSYVVEMKGISKSLAKRGGRQEPMAESNRGRTSRLARKTHVDPLGVTSHSSSKQTANGNCNAGLICFI